MTINIRTKLLLAFGFVILLCSAVNIYGLIQMDVLAGLTTKIYNHPLQVTRAVLSADTGIVKMHRSMKDVALAADVAEINAAHAVVNQYEQEVYKQFAIVEEWILGKEGATLIAKTIQIFKDWTPIREEVIVLMKNGQQRKAAAITKGKGAKHVALLNRQMQALRDYAANKANHMYQNAQATRSSVIGTTLISLLIVIILSGLLSFLLAHHIVKSVRIINAIAQQLVAGDLTETKQVGEVTALKDEMGEIGRAFDAVTHSFKTVINDIVYISQNLAAGNLQVTPQAEYHGDLIQIKKGLETAMSNQLHVVKDIVQVSQGLAAGNQNVKAQAEYRGDFVQIKEALETAAGKLAEATRQNIQQDWIKTGQAQLNGAISGEQENVKLAKKILTFLIPYAEAQVGLFYLLKQDESYLEAIATYAYTNTVLNRFKIGEGLIGEAVMEQKTLFRSHSYEEYTHIIQSGLANAVPHYVLIIPFFYEGAVKGVLEIGFSKEPTSLQQDFLQQVMPIIGVAVNTAESRTQMERLLSTTS